MHTPSITVYPSLRARNPRRVESAPYRLDINTYATWSGFWQDAHRQLSACGYTRATRLFYRHILRAFSQFAGKPPSAVTSGDLRAYLRSLTDKRPTWHWTAMNISVLRGLFDKLADLKALNHLRGPRRKRTLPTALHREEVSKLFAAAPTLRDQLILALLYGCGLKTGDLQAIRWRDMDTEVGTLRVVSRYSGQWRVLRLPSAILPLLRHGNAQCSPDDRLFPGAKPGDPISARTVQRIVRLTGESAGLAEPITPMHLRHSFAVHFIEDGGNIRELQEALDHQLIESTMQYEVLRPVQATTDAHPIQIDPGRETLLTPIFPLAETKSTFMHRLRVQIKGRFLALRRAIRSG